jgi:hypothetical protein
MTSVHSERKRPITAVAENMLSRLENERNGGAKMAKMVDKTATSTRQRKKMRLS